MKIIDTATQAIAHQHHRLAASAGRIAKCGDIHDSNSLDLAAEVVEQIDASNITRANLNVIKTEDERTATLLDIIV